MPSNPRGTSTRFTIVARAVLVRFSERSTSERRQMRETVRRHSRNCAGPTAAINLFKSFRRIEDSSIRDCW
jgi:hypothetical protein